MSKLLAQRRVESMADALAVIFVIGMAWFGTLCSVLLLGRFVLVPILTKLFGRN